MLMIIIIKYQTNYTPRTGSLTTYVRFICS